MGKAMIVYKVFINAACNIGCLDTNTWTEWCAWALITLQSDILVGLENVECLDKKLEQKGSADKFVESY